MDKQMDKQMGVYKDMFQPSRRWRIRTDRGILPAAFKTKREATRVYSLYLAAEIVKKLG